MVGGYNDYDCDYRVCDKKVTTGQYAISGTARV